MAATPRWKIYNPDGAYVAATRDLEDAAVLVAHLGNRATIRADHGKKYTVWCEGAESQSAAESFDYVRDVALARAQARVYWPGPEHPKAVQS